MCLSPSLSSCGLKMPTVGLHLDLSGPNLSIIYIRYNTTYIQFWNFGLSSLDTNNLVTSLTQIMVDSRITIFMKKRTRKGLKILTGNIFLWTGYPNPTFWWSGSQHAESRPWFSAPWIFFQKFLRKIALLHLGYNP